MVYPLLRSEPHYRDLALTGVLGAVVALGAGVGVGAGAGVGVAAATNGAEMNTTLLRLIQYLSPSIQPALLSSMHSNETQPPAPPLIVLNVATPSPTPILWIEPGARPSCFRGDVLLLVVVRGDTFTGAVGVDGVTFCAGGPTAGGVVVCA